MRFYSFLLIVVSVGLLALAPNPISGEVLYVKDGSKLQGTLVKFVNDTLYFRTTFGAVIEIERDKIVRIEFAPGATAGPTTGSMQVPADTAAPGTLIVSFEKFKLTTRISVHRDKNRPAHERANSIEQVLFVNGVQVYSYRDSTTDKVIKKGVEVILKNEMKPAEFSVVLEPGVHRCEILIGNTLAEGFEELIDGDPLEKTVAVDAIVIRSGESTTMRVGLKKSKLGLGKSSLQVVQQR